MIPDRRDIIKRFAKTVRQKPFIGILLDFYEIRHIQHFFTALIAHPHGVPFNNGFKSVLFHV